MPFFLSANITRLTLFTTKGHEYLDLDMNNNMINIICNLL